MTDDTERVLANIHDAIEGYVTWDPETSADAMRWRPEQPERPARTGGIALGHRSPPMREQEPPPRVSSRARAYLAPAGAGLDHPETWTELGHIVGDGFAVGGIIPNQEENWAAANRALSSVVEQARCSIVVVSRAFEQMVRAVRDAAQAVTNQRHPKIAPRLYGEDYRRHRRSCRLCNPTGNPKPLKVDAGEYRRRRNRRRRG